MADDIYGSAVTGGLKLKGVKSTGIKKKKKKKKSKAEEITSLATSSTIEQEQPETGEETEQQRETKTQAEIAFEKAQEKRAADRILKKASKTHKQRVEELNQYLDGLSEHYDIQKVSWTK